EIAAGETREILFYIGDTAGANEARRVLAEQLKRPFEKTLAASKAIWTGFLDGLQVDTPDDAFDVMVNRWLPYQSLACRIWARTAFY
ncbi:hypothetical protein KC221_26265, partial [Mycobacterium tuberculosis]|nr:hypothetical protein [Mycobacterium tuberculosis]